ncbi:MAG: fibronectin type III domain-containing protein [Saprospiraceae bacterium]|nr:fibronectin type III domain-containing protein [Saprospiraceae bacterium]
MKSKTILLILLTLNQILLAQKSQKNKTFPPQLAVPEGVSATDGASADYIDIHWIAKGSGTTYRVFRSDNPSVIGAEITSKPQIVGFFRDGDRLFLRQGRRYYYRVKAQLNGKESAFSKADDGFLKAVAAGHDSNSLSQKEAQKIDLQGLELNIRPLDKTTIKHGDSISVRYIIVNKGNAPLSNLIVHFTSLAKNVYNGSEMDIEIEKINLLQIGASHRNVAILPTKVLHSNAIYDLTLWVEDPKTGQSERAVLPQSIIIEQK